MGLTSTVVVRVEECKEGTDDKDVGVLVEDGHFEKSGYVE